MNDIGHLNPAISRFEAGEPVFATVTPAERGAAAAATALPHDAVIFEMEHAPWNGSALRDSLQYLFDRRATFSAASLAPPVAPFVRIPPNGEEMSQWHAKQALDSGVYGVVWPQVRTVAEARNAVAACRYPRAAGDPAYEPAGLRGFGPSYAARYWGLNVPEYCEHADTWPASPAGDVLTIVMCESPEGVEALPRMLADVPGIGAILIGSGDLSMNMGHGPSPANPEVEEATMSVVEACKTADVPCGIVVSDDVEERLEQGFRLILPLPPRSRELTERGRAWFDAHR